MRSAAAAVALLCAAAAGSLPVAPAAPLLTVTPWCENSFRVQLAPSSLEHPGAAAAAGALRAQLAGRGLRDLPAALIDACGPGAPAAPQVGVPLTNGALRVTLGADGALAFSSAATQAPYFSARLALAPGAHAPYLAASLDAAAGDVGERLFGLGQTGWTDKDTNGCPNSTQVVVPLQRNGQTVDLQQTKFHVAIPFVYSTAGYGLLYNMPGYGSAAMGALGTGGMAWRSEAALGLDFWVTAAPAGAGPAAVYRQYADATGHAPLLREDAMLFWQSRLRYKSSDIALQVAARYAALDPPVPVGVLVVDFYNNVNDGDFTPNAACFPSLAALTSSVRALINASVVFSVWPEVAPNSTQRAAFSAAGCLANADLGGSVLDTTIPACREMIWALLLPHYYSQGVTAFWLDETDGEGTAGGDGTHGYDTSYGPAAAYSQLWVGSWLQTFTEPVAVLGEVAPLALTRGVWAGGQRHGVVLWSSDVESTFETLAAMVPQGVHASMSGIPWWTSDVGGFGCSRPGSGRASDSPYFQELITRWMQFGLFCVRAACAPARSAPLRCLLPPPPHAPPTPTRAPQPVFRTHGCRQGPSEPQVAPCTHVAGSCGSNEIWAYGNATQALLSDLIRFRASVLKPYIAALAANVSAEGVPTMRPLWYEFPQDPACYGVDDQYLLGPELLVAPVTAQGATNRSVVFPAGADWVSVWDSSVVEAGGGTRVVQAPLSVIPVYRRRAPVAQ